MIAYGMAGPGKSFQKHSHTVPGGRGYWLTEKLWAAAADLHPRRIRIDSIPELNRDCWFGQQHAPTIRNVAEHLRKIADADLSYPIILGSDGRLLDGGHRSAKAYLRGDTEILAVQFDNATQRYLDAYATKTSIIDLAELLRTAQTETILRRGK